MFFFFFCPNPVLVCHWEGKYHTLQCNWVMPWNLQEKLWHEDKITKRGILNPCADIKASDIMAYGSKNNVSIKTWVATHHIYYIIKISRNLKIVNRLDRKVLQGQLNWIFQDNSLDYFQSNLFNTECITRKLKVQPPHATPVPLLYHTLISKHVLEHTVPIAKFQILTSTLLCFFCAK